MIYYIILLEHYIISETLSYYKIYLGKGNRIHYEIF